VLQEDQQVEWLHNAEAHHISTLEHKDALITQLYQQLQQQQLAGDAVGARVMYSGHGSDGASVDATAQKLLLLEKEVLTKRLEVEELRTKVLLLRK